MSNDDKEDSNSCCGGHHKDEQKGTEYTEIKESQDAEKARANRVKSGLTQQLGKPIVESSDSLTKKQENVESSYMQIRKAKRFAMSGISTAFGDLLGTTTERSKEIEEENRAKLAADIEKKCQSTDEPEKKSEEKKLEQ